MRLKDYRDGAWDWMAFATALVLIVAVVLLVVVLVPQNASEDLSSNPVAHEPTSGRS